MDEVKQESAEFKAYKKTIRTILSCKNVEELQVAERMVENFGLLYNEMGTSLFHRPLVNTLSRMHEKITTENIKSI